MKKITKAIAASAILVSLMSSCASTKNAGAGKPEKQKTEKAAKAEKTKKEKPAKEKAAKPAKAKKAKFDQAAYDEAYTKGDYDTCIAMLNGKNDAINLVKDNLDANMLTYWKKDNVGAVQGLKDTYYLMTNVSKELTAGDVMKAALTSESSVKYKGAIYERYLDWSMRIAASFSENRTDEAKGVVQDYAGNNLKEIEELRKQEADIEKSSASALEGDDFKNAVKSLETAGVDLGIVGLIADIPPKTDKDYQYSSCFGYLGTLAWAAYDDFDHAEQFAKDFKVKNIEEALNVPAGKGHLEVVAFSGTIGKRGEFAKQRNIELPGVPKPIYTKLTYPKFDSAVHQIKSVRIKLSDGTIKNAEIIEDFDEAVRIDVEKKARGAAQRSIFRNVIKNAGSAAAVIAANEGLKKADNPMLQKVAMAAFDKAYDPAVAAIVNLEKADTRQGEYFPHMASAAGFTVAPGTYQVTVEYLNGKDVVYTSAPIDVVVNEGKVSVAVSSCEK